ncbi:MAG TPA: ArsB/NhaD family transporter [Stellaceae bacterium]|nr:ArsB/NhaD family transporter [Stellaceae bacterium]
MASGVIFGLSPVLVAATILVVTYALVISDRFDRSILAILGAGLMILSGVLDQDEAIRGIDFNTIALLTGMMVLVAIARRSGIFEFLALRSAQLVNASPAGVLILLSAVTALVSSLLDNVTTVLLIAPVTLSIAQRLKIAPFPFLFAEVMASNIGGTATLIGDPPNIMIGSAAGLSFNAFILGLTPIILVVLAFQLAATHLIWGRSAAASAAARAEVMALKASSAITDPRLLRIAIAVFAATLLAFIFARALRLEPGSIALIGAAALMLLDNLAHHREAQAARIVGVYGDVDWITIFFFVGLFVVVHGFVSTGAMAAVAQTLVKAFHGNLAITASAILWASAVLSALIDNIPFVAAMIPLIKLLAPAFGGEEALLPLWWALSLGACLGGNGTLIGASANLTVAGFAQRNGVRFDFLTYTKWAAPLTLMSIVLCQIYLWLRFF